MDPRELLEPQDRLDRQGLSQQPAQQGGQDRRGIRVGQGSQDRQDRLDRPESQAQRRLQGQEGRQVRRDRPQPRAQQDGQDPRGKLDRQVPWEQRAIRVQPEIQVPQAILARQDPRDEPGCADLLERLGTRDPRVRRDTLGFSQRDPRDQVGQTVALLDRRVAPDRQDSRDRRVLRASRGEPVHSDVLE